MRFALGAVTFAAAASVALSSLAATLTAIEGQVSVNRGSGFQRVTGTVQVNVGDSIMASPGADAELVYDDGCRLLVGPGSVVTVTAKSPCVEMRSEGPSETNKSPKDPLAATEPATDNTIYYVAGAVVVAGGAGAAILLLAGKDKPSSP